MSAMMEDWSPSTTNTLDILPDKGALATVRHSRVVAELPVTVFPVASMVTSEPSINSR